MSGESLPHDWEVPECPALSHRQRVMGFPLLVFVLLLFGSIAIGLLFRHPLTAAAVFGAAIWIGRQATAADPAFAWELWARKVLAPRDMWA